MAHHRELVALAGCEDPAAHAGGGVQAWRM